MKGSDSRRKQAKTAYMAAIGTGAAQVPYALLKYYERLKLSETDVMLLIHVLAFIEKERKEFPTLEELKGRMTASPETVIGSLQKLLKNGIISIDQETDPLTGIQFERYNFAQLYDKLADCWIDEMKEKAEQEAAREEANNIFSKFESEFGRPLTPMEMETISGWLDQDGYSEAIIMAALKEAVFAGKVYFKYIDRILLDWSRNRVSTVEQAKQYSQKFRMR